MTLALTGAGAIHKLQKFAVVIRDALNELIKTLPKGPAIIFLCLCLPVLGGCTMPWQESQEAKDASEFRTKSYGSFAANMERIVEALNQAYKRAEFERIDLLYQMDVDALKANYAKAAVKEPDRPDQGQCRRLSKGARTHRPRCWLSLMRWLRS